jgi:hypothetical protein
MNSPRCTFTHTLLTLAAVVFACVGIGLAQETTKSTAQVGEAQHQVNIQRGEVVYVSGNDLVVKDLDSGELKAFVVPDTARATVDGKEVSVHDLKPGMTLERTITTTTTPRVVTEVTTIQGKIWSINPPKHIILQMPGGENKQYTIPANQKFVVNGQEVDAFHLKKGMNVTATVIREAPVTEVAEHRVVSGTAPETPPMQGALLIDESDGKQASAAPPVAMAKNAGETAQADNRPRLPQTGSELPMLAVCGLLLFGAGIRAFRLS